MKVSGDALKELGWREMEKVPAFPGLTDTSAEPRLCIPGGGITKGLYTDRYMHNIGHRRSEWFFWNPLLNGGADIHFVCLFVFSCAQDIPLAVLLLFCSEGDNIPDALALVNHLNDWLHLLDNPVSSGQRFTACAASRHEKCIRTIHSGTVESKSRTDFSSFLLVLICRLYVLLFLFCLKAIGSRRGRHSHLDWVDVSCAV